MLICGKEMSSSEKNKLKDKAFFLLLGMFLCPEIEEFIILINNRIYRESNKEGLKQIQNLVGGH